MLTVSLKSSVMPARHQKGPPSSTKSAALARLYTTVVLNVRGKIGKLMATKINARSSRQRCWQ